MFFEKLQISLFTVKRFLVAILALLYLTIASGVVVNLHYCMGDLASIEFGHAADHPCAKCGMEEKKGCCETESKLVKLQDAHQWAKPAFDALKVMAVVQGAGFTSMPVLQPASLPASASYQPPPDFRQNKVYRSICVFRI